MKFENYCSVVGGHLTIHYIALCLLLEFSTLLCSYMGSKHKPFNLDDRALCWARKAQRSGWSLPLTDTSGSGHFFWECPAPRAFAYT